MNKFDLNKALSGEPVVLRNGQKAYVRHRETDFETSYPLIGYTVYGTGGSESSWTVDGNFFADKEETASDIVGMWTEQICFNHWSLLHPDIKWIAKDLDGKWTGYMEKPELEYGVFDEWICGGDDIDYLILEGLSPDLFPECDWKDSLIKRPEK